jgi:hypothetical protein
MKGAEVVRFSTGFLPRSAQAMHGASGVSGRRLPGPLLSVALRAICDMKNLRGTRKGALGSPRRLVVTLGSKLRPFVIGLPEDGLADAEKTPSKAHTDCEGVT